MADDDTTATLDTESSIDIEAASDQIGAELFPEHEETKTPQETVTDALLEKPATETKVTPVETLAPAVRQAPKSWAKEIHPLWEKTDPKVQDYIDKREKDFLEGTRQYTSAAQFAKSIHDVLTPYQPMLQSRGLDAPKVIDDMLGSYARLTQGTMEQRQAALMQVAKHLQIALPTQNGDQSAPTIDPRIQTLEQQFQQVQQAITQQQQAALTAAREKAAAEVHAFASDPKNALFDECHDDIVKFLTAGDSLQEAYDKAVWANPVTREKNKQAWFQTETQKASERARLDALPKKKAQSVNVHGRDTQRSPTDPLGSMEDTMRSTLRDIKSRTAH